MTLTRTTGRTVVRRALAGSAVGAITAAALATAAPASADPGKTTITMRVTGCNGCTIGAQRAISPDSTVTPSTPDYWNGPRVKVSGGVATLKVPTDYTPGMSFTIRAPWETGELGAVTNIVLGVAGDAPGGRITAAEMKGTRRATACWAGTSDVAVTIKVAVVPTTRPGIGGRATVPLSWAKPTVATVGPMQRAYGGILANQDAFYC